MKNFGRLIKVYLAAGALALVDEKIKSDVEAGKINNGVIYFPEMFNKKLPLTIEKHHNSGFAGNRLDDRQPVVAIVAASLTAVQFCLTGAYAVDGDSKLLNAANMLLLAGALSNTKDRVCRHYVVDYLKIKDKIYNLSDFLLFAGASLSMLYAFTKNGDSKHRH